MIAIQLVFGLSFFLGTPFLYIVYDSLYHPRWYDVTRIERKAIQQSPVEIEDTCIALYNLSLEMVEHARHIKRERRSTVKS